MRGLRTITSLVRTPCVSCSSLATALCVLRLSYVSQKTQTNRKENEHVENLLWQPCDLVFRTTALRCCSQHREAAVRNQEMCRLRQVHGCRKADVKHNYRHMLIACSCLTVSFAVYCVNQRNLNKFVKKFVIKKKS